MSENTPVSLLKNCCIEIWQRYKKNIWWIILIVVHFIYISPLKHPKQVFLSDVHNTLIHSGFPMCQTLGKSQFVWKWKTCLTARSRPCGSLSFLWHDNVVHFWLKLPLLQHLVSLWQQSNSLVIENNACVMLAKWMGGYVSQKVVVQTEKKRKKYIGICSFKGLHTSLTETCMYIICDLGGQ